MEGKHVWHSRSGGVSMVGDGVVCHCRQYFEIRFARCLRGAHLAKYECEFVRQSEKSGGICSTKKYVDGYVQSVLL